MLLAKGLNNMIRFECDYAEGAHPEIIKRLTETNLEQTSGYGEDGHCANARRLIQFACDAKNADVHFLVGGTQTNMTVISAALRPHQGVIAAETGHINVHETGAVEATGHKVIALPSKDGKLTAEQIKQTVRAHHNDLNHEHIVQPAMVYISNPTETGTIYYKSELEAINAVCREASIPLFLDGARLGYGLAAEGNNLTLKDIATLCDVFYIGGTKVGALFGEAVVITNDALKRDFRYLMKQRGAMLAKGRLLGIQFETLFEDGLYFRISQHAIDMAMLIRDAFRAKGFCFLCESPTNQQFPILTQQQIDALKQDFAFEIWTQTGETTFAVRFCTSWATRREDVDALLNVIKSNPTLTIR